MLPSNEAHAKERMVGGKQTTDVLNHGFIVLMWQTE
jgi:hypothetical protein